MLYVKHNAGDFYQCQMWKLCHFAFLSGAVAVIDAPMEIRPIGSTAAVSYLYPQYGCTIPYLTVGHNLQNPSFPLAPGQELFSDYVDPILNNGTNLTVVLNSVPNQWFVDCQRGGSFFQVWQWTSVALTAIGLVLLIIRIVTLFIANEFSFISVPIFACAFASLAFFYQLLRNAVNPSACYGQVYLWSSEIDAFLFTADVPAVISAMLVLAFYQLEVLQPKRLQGATLDRLRIPAALIIIGLFVLQIVVVVLVQVGRDPSNEAVIVQAIIFILCFLFLLVFYSFATFKLARKLYKFKSGRSHRDVLLGPLLLAAFAIVGCLFAFAAAGIVLAGITYTEVGFVLLETLSDLSTLSCCFGIVFVVKAKPPKAKEIDANRARAASAVPVIEMSSAREKSTANLSPVVLVNPYHQSIVVDNDEEADDDTFSPGRILL